MGEPASGASGAIGFAPLARADYARLAVWLREPLVARWWNHATGDEDLERDFGPAIDGAEPGEVFLATLAGEPFGLIQRYRIDAYPEYAAELAGVWAAPAGALGIDYLIGEPQRRGRGLGTALIAAFAESCWAEDPGAAAIVAAVAAANRRSWRALERAGFERVGEGDMTPDNPRDGRRHVVYRLPRPGGPTPRS